MCLRIDIARYVIGFLTSVFDFIQLLRERSQFWVREVAHLKERKRLCRIAYSDLYTPRDKGSRKRLGMYLQKKRHRHDSLRSMQRVREVVVKLRVEAEYLQL